MAKIFKTDTQEQALKEIVESLKIVSTLNVLLADEEVDECKIRINGNTSSGVVNEQIPIPYAMITPQLKDYRKKLIKEILDKSRNHSIRLEDNENKIIGLKTKKEAANPIVAPVRTGEGKEQQDTELQGMDTRSPEEPQAGTY